MKNCLLTACACAAFGILSVLFSVGKPAKMAGSVSPVEAVRYAGDDRDTEGRTDRTRDCQRGRWQRAAGTATGKRVS
ncbi:MAG: hypothetical protein ACLRMZ_26980 [Blautia marasmi]